MAVAADVSRRNMSAGSFEQCEPGRKITPFIAEEPFMNDASNADNRSEKEIFFAALEQPNAEARAGFLDGACGKNPVVRQRIEKLLADHFEDDSFLQSAAVDSPPAARQGAPVQEGPGVKIGRYKLLEKVGEGGFGEVWMAEQREPVKRRVALKIIKLGMDSRQVVARFEAERQALAMMDHPNIAKVFDAGATDTGRPYFVMELVRGVKITEYCDNNALPTHERLKLFIFVCQAIQHAHQKGIIHRDIKPSNILVTLHDGVPVPKVIDFGIAKATQGELTDKTVFTQFQQFIGTPAYISPEQAEMSGLDIDTRADIYSLGVLLYELLVGQTPFDAKEMMKGGIDALRQIIREKQPIKPSTRLKTFPAAQMSTTAQRRRTDAVRLRHQLRGDLDWIVMKCLEKDRTRRYETANELAMDIQRHLANEPILARPPSQLYYLQKLIWRHKPAFAVAVIIVAALISVLVMSLAYALRERAHTFQLQRDLAHQHLIRGQSLCRQGDVTRGLHWMTRALEEVPAASHELISTIRQNLGSWSGRAEAPLAALPHDGTARVVAYSSDGASLLTGSEDGTARLWRADTGEPMGQPMRHEGSVLVAVFSPDSQSVLTASRDKTVRLWSAQDGTAKSFVVRHAAEPTVALFSPDGTQVLTASQDGAARLWAPQSGEPLSPWLRHEGSVRVAAFEPRGSLVVMAGADGTVRFWSGDRGEPRGEALRLSRGVAALAFSPDGQQLLTGSDDHTARLWSVATRQAIGPPLQHRGPVSTVQFSPDGSRLLTGSSDGVARLWSAATGQPIGFEMQHGAPVLVVRFTPNGKRILTGSENNSLMFWSAETGKPLGAPIPHEGWVWSVAFSPDGRRMLTGADDHSAKLWSIEPPGKEDQIIPHGKVVKSAAFSPDGARVLVGGQSNEIWHGSARLWSVQTGEPGPVLPHPGLIWAVAFSPDGRWLLTGGRDGLARLWSAQTLEPSPIQFHHPFDVRCAAFSKDGRFVASGDFDRTAVVWSTSTGKAVFAPFQHAQYVEDVAFSPDGTLLATACGDGVVRLWSLQTGRQAGPTFQHRGSVLAVTFSPDGQQLLTGSTDHSARFWDVHTGASIGRALEHPSWVEDVAFSPDGRRVATCDAFDSAWLWSRATGELLAPPFKHTGPINEIEFSSDGQRLLTASHDTTARIWNIPAPFSGTVRQARPWVEALSGKAMDEHGVLSWLDARTWRVRREDNQPRQ